MSWIFYRGMDSSNGDICIKSGAKVELLQQTAQANHAVAFNTLGFIKNYVTLPLQTSNYFGPNDGIYIKKEVIDSLALGEHRADAYDDLDIKMN